MLPEAVVLLGLLEIDGLFFKGWTKANRALDGTDESDFGALVRFYREFKATCKEKKVFPMPYPLKKPAKEFLAKHSVKNEKMVRRAEEMMLQVIDDMKKGGLSPCTDVDLVAQREFKSNDLTLAMAAALVDCIMKKRLQTDRYSEYHGPSGIVRLDFDSLCNREEAFDWIIIQSIRKIPRKERSIDFICVASYAAPIREVSWLSNAAPHLTKTRETHDYDSERDAVTCTRETGFNLTVVVPGHFSTDQFIALFKEELESPDGMAADCFLRHLIDKLCCYSIHPQWTDNLKSFFLSNNTIMSKMTTLRTKLQNESITCPADWTLDCSPTFLKAFFRPHLKGARSLRTIPVDFHKLRLPFPSEEAIAKCFADNDRLKEEQYNQWKSRQTAPRPSPMGYSTTTTPGPSSSGSQSSSSCTLL